MEKLNYFFRRFLLVIPTFLGITILCFALTQFVPGGPVEQAIAQLSGQGSPITERVTRSGTGETLAPATQAEGSANPAGAVNWVC